MRADPVEPPADACHRLDIHFVAGRHVEETRQVEATPDRHRLSASIDPQDCILVVADDEMLGIEGDCGRRIARSAIAEKLRRVCPACRTDRREQGDDHDGQHCLHLLAPW